MDLTSIKKKWAVGLLIGVLVFIVLALWGDVRQLTASLAQLEWRYLPLIFGFTFLGYILRFLKWEVFLRAIGVRIRLVDSLVVFLSGFSMAVTPGKAGEVVKSFLLKRSKNIEVSRTAPVVLAERVTDLLAMLLLAAWGVSRFPGGEWLLGMTAVFLLLLIGAIQFRGLCAGVFAWLNQRSRWTGLIEKVETFYESSFVLFRFPVLLVTTGISILSWFLECVSLYYVFLGIGLDRSLIDAVFVFSFSSIAGAVSMLPGGLGVAETSMAGMLMGLGISRGDAVLATLLGRFGTLWFGVLLGWLVLLVWGRGMLQRGERERK